MGLLEALGLKPKTSAAPAPAPGASAKASAAPSAPPAENLAFIAARAGVKSLIDGLNAHAQKAKVQTQIDSAAAKLAEADVQAAKSDWAKATQALVEAKTICDAAKKLADNWAAWSVKRANAQAQVNAVDGVMGSNGMATMTTALTNADNFVKAVPPNFTQAIAALGGVDTAAKNFINNVFLGTVNTGLANIAAQPASARAFAATEIAQAKKLVADVNTAMAASNWSQAMMAVRYALRIVPPTDRTVGRRAAYEAARPAAVAAIAALNASVAVKDRAPPLQARLNDADALANHDTMRFEDAIVVLGEITKGAALWQGLAATIGSYRSERPLADAELAALDKNAAAAKVAPARESARALLAQAAKSAAGAEKSGDAAAWATALEALHRARADLAEGKKLADGLASTVSAEAAAGAKIPDVTAMKAALQALNADAATAGAAPFAAEAAAEFKRFHEQATKADAALTKNDGKAAAAPLAEASRTLTQGKTIQAGHARYTSNLAAVDARLKALQALPRVALLKGKIDPVAKALAEAAAKDKAHAGAEALAALRRATDAATAAEKADKDRGKFDTDSAALTAPIAAVADPKVKKELGDAVAGAKKLADAFRFDDADKALKQVGVRLEEAKLRAAASANPADPNIAKFAAEMVAKGGAKNVDALIKSMPAGTDPQVLALVAQGRFGVQFTVDPRASRKPRELTAMKALCETFAKVPKDVKADGSIKSIAHADATKEVSGGYGSSDSSIDLTGRPNVDTQGFGADLTKKSGGKIVKQLPDKLDPDCKAVGAPSELLSFTALHEVGHGVDDEHTFMLRNGSGDLYGGWIRYGAGVDPIADAVGPFIAKKIGGTTTFFKKPEDRQYVIARLLNQPGVRPAAPKDSDDAKALDAFDHWYGLATSPGVYEREPDCKNITIGDRIYHEAYKRDWVSYLAAARNKGLTGYQFRAPGEWFAELYAAYKSKKLGPKHPAVAWLKKL